MAMKGLDKAKGWMERMGWQESVVFPFDFVFELISTLIPKEEKD